MLTRRVAAASGRARSFGGPWNSRGQRIVDPSTSLGARRTEGFADLEANLSPADLVSVGGEIPRAVVCRLNPKTLHLLVGDRRVPAGWRIGERCRSLRLAAAVWGEWNVPLNPAHADLVSLEERFDLLTSEAILKQASARVLRYAKIKHRHGWSDFEVREFVEDVAKLAILVPREVKLAAVVEDPSDDRYLECPWKGKLNTYKRRPPPEKGWRTLKAWRSSSPSTFWLK